MIRERVLDEATSLGLRVYQNYYGQWVIKDFNINTWLLQEHKSGKWIMIVKKKPQAIFTAETLLRILTEESNQGANTRRFFPYLSLRRSE